MNEANKFSVFLSSDQRDNITTSNSNDCLFNIRKSSSFPPRVYNLVLETFTIPNTVYNINSSNNNLLWTRGGDQSATIPAGNYTSTTLATAIKTAMDGASDGNTYTVSYSATTFKYTITGSASAFNFRFDDAVNTPWKEMGFNQVTTGSALTQTSSNIVDLSFPRDLFIEIEGFSRRPFLILGSTEIAPTFHITLSETGGILEYKERNEKQIAYIESTDELYDDYLRVRLLDANGSLYDFNNANWTMFFHAEFAATNSGYKEARKRKRI